MYCHCMAVTFQIQYVIYKWISELPPAFHRNPPAKVCSQKALQKSVRLLLISRLQQITRCLHLIALQSKIRRSSQKYNGCFYPQLAQSSGSINSVQLTHINIKKNQIRPNITVFDFCKKAFTGNEFPDLRLPTGCSKVRHQLTSQHKSFNLYVITYGYFFYQSSPKASSYFTFFIITEIFRFLENLHNSHFFKHNPQVWSICRAFF